MFNASATSWPRSKSFSCLSIVHRLHYLYREMTDISPLHLPIQLGEADDPLHYVRLRWRRFSGSLRLWRPTWAWPDGQEPPPSTFIYLTRSEPIKVETYELTGPDFVLEFSNIANADDALAFADHYGFLGTEMNTAAVSMGLTQVSELPFKTTGGWGITGHRPVTENFTAKRRDSSLLLILKREDVSFGDAKATSIPIHSSPSDLREHLSISDANAILRVVRKSCQEFPRGGSGPWTVHILGLIGARKIRPCEICDGLMDVTNNTRRKKVHDHCSRRECMRRYRRARDGKKTRKQ
jgi:hypothetical protein